MAGARLVRVCRAGLTGRTRSGGALRERRCGSGAAGAAVARRPAARAARTRTTAHAGTAGHARTTGPGHRARPQPRRCHIVVHPATTLSHRGGPRRRAAAAAVTRTAQATAGERPELPPALARPVIYGTRSSTTSGWYRDGSAPQAQASRATRTSREAIASWSRTIAGTNGTNRSGAPGAASE